MKNLSILSFVFLMLSSCSMSQYKNETYGQCRTNPAIDGTAITFITGIPLAIASSSTPLGIGAGIIMGGGYYIAHNATCK